LIDEDIENFVQYIENDIYSLGKGISNNEEDLKEIFKYINRGISFFSLSFDYFIELLNKYCFNIDSSDNKKGSSVEIKERLLIFERLFVADNEQYFTQTYLFSYNNIWGQPTFEPLFLFYLLYYGIFKQFLLDSKDIVLIFKDLLNQWQKALETSRMPIKIISYLPILAKIGIYPIDDKFFLISGRPHLKIEKLPNAKRIYKNYILSYFPFDKRINYNEVSSMRVYLIYNTNISFKLSERFQLDENDFLLLQQEFESKMKKFNEMIQTMYLLEKDFKYEGFIVEYPWWFIPNIHKFDKFKKIIRKIIFLDEQDINEVINLFSKVQKSRIFLDNQFEILTYRYFQVYNRNYFPDIVLDAFIIFELLFTRKILTELKFRLCLNGALFISSDWDEFKKNNNLIKDLYNLRSKIVHGGNWKKIINKFKEKYHFKNEESIITMIKSLLNRTLKKLIVLKLGEPEILKSFEDKYYFFENSDILLK